MRTQQYSDHPGEMKTWKATVQAGLFACATTSLFVSGSYVIFLGLPESVSKFIARSPQVAASATELMRLGDSVVGGGAVFETIRATDLSR
jgi:hypothetical protein